MSDPTAAYVVDLVCRDCDAHLQVRETEPALLWARVHAFFEEHVDCSTVIDLSQAPGLRLPPEAEE